MSTEEIESPPIPKPLAYILMIVVLAAIISFFTNFWSGDKEEVEDVIVIPNSTPTPTTSSAFDEDASRAIFEKKINGLEKRDAELVKELQLKEERYKELLDEAKQDLTEQIKLLASGIQESNRIRITDRYDGLPVGTEDDSLGIDFDISDLEDIGSNTIAPVKKKRKHPFGEDYILLSGLNQGQITKDGEDDEESNNLFTNLSDISDASERVANGEGKLDDPYKDNDKKSTRNSRRSINETVVEKTKKTTIPATSFVKVTTLFGVNCPIGGQVVGSDSTIPPRPVVLPVRGIFYGPRGSSFDLGTAHIYGTCAARRTGDSDIGRAEIKINKISYWDKLGGSQWENASGAIVDERDNALDVAGYIDKVKSANIAKEAAAAAILAYSATLSSKEFVQTVGGLGGSQSALTGDELKAAGAQGVTALFKKYADRWENEANSAVDTVLVPAGIPLRFVTDSPIVVEQAADPIELAYDKFYDILI
jgi:hypothetical protein